MNTFINGFDSILLPLLVFASGYVSSYVIREIKERRVEKQHAEFLGSFCRVEKTLVYIDEDCTQQASSEITRAISNFFFDNYSNIPAGRYWVKEQINIENV